MYARAAVGAVDAPLKTAASISLAAVFYGKTAPVRVRSQLLILFRGDILHDLLDPAVQDPAQIVDGGRGQGLVPAQLVQG